MIDEQIEKLLELENGWYNGYGEAPSKTALIKFKELFDANHIGDKPSIFPTIDGDIQLEWGENLMAVDLESFEAILITEDDEFEIDLKYTPNWKNLVF